MRRTITVLFAVLSLLAVGVTSSAAAPGGDPGGGDNDFSCRLSPEHPRPVVVLHGLGATYYEDLNFLQADLAQRGWCTFSLTYGAYPGFPFVGGLRAIADSAPEIKAFVQRVAKATGAQKVDIVGHSEGGFQSLYVTKTQGISHLIDKVVAIAPPTHGTTFGGLYKLAYLFGSVSRELIDQVLRLFGCPACTDLGPDGRAVKVLNDGPITRPGVTYTIITSRYDEMVTPTETSFVREPGVTNQYVQDFCPLDPVGHIGEAYDTNVWHLVRNALDPANATPINPCSVGSPG
ncbi:lipase (class 2) [Herbihabitans rhizosphaerae]|uniref:Lipase (Class 2) n=1 Tax=Herbihabitans rhizosphaerae TaxID=1872711 RepID=A0A4V2ES71_9PSEU|nr:alpha/beta fold hydrolase [Herbihabitans rhizosphaerae]RZS36553.1 lipase (class 2) [Herbihabitans rhizosphaerae]